MASKNVKFTALLNYRLRVTVQDGRMLVGQLVAFDKHMNLVLADCEEFRRTKRGKLSKKQKMALAESTEGVSPALVQIAANMEEKRTLGMLILRGENIVSVTVEAGPPPVSDPSNIRVSAATLMGAGPGKHAAPIIVPGFSNGPPAGLAGPIRGVGLAGSASGMLPPQMASGMPPPMPPGFPISGNFPGVPGFVPKP